MWELAKRRALEKVIYGDSLHGNLYFCGKLTNPFSSFSKDIHSSLQNLLFEVRGSGPILSFFFCLSVPLEFQENIFIHVTLLDERRKHPGSQV